MYHLKLHEKMMDKHALSSKRDKELKCASDTSIHIVIGEGLNSSIENISLHIIATH